MQYLTILFIISSIVIVESLLTPEDLIQFQKTVQRCNNNTHVDSSTINQALRGQIVNDHEFDCFIACILNGINISNSDGSLNMNNALDKVPQNMANHDIIINAIKSCGDRKGNDKCETAHMLFQCMQENNIPSILLA